MARGRVDAGHVRGTGGCFDPRLPSNKDHSSKVDMPRLDMPWQPVPSPHGPHGNERRYRILNSHLPWNLICHGGRVINASRKMGPDMCLH